MHHTRCMMYAVPMKRITINVPESVALKAQRAVDSGSAESLSGYFCELAKKEPDWAMAREAIDELIERVGGISADARHWALETMGFLDDDPYELSVRDENRALVTA